METETKYNNLKSYEISVYIIFWVPLIPTDWNDAVLYKVG